MSKALREEDEGGKNMDAVQTSLFNDNAEYDAFLAKFEPKKTTDDCYTPPIVYDAVADWVAKEYGVEKCCFVRPFYPGGDFENYEYADGCIVVDNPPFSIMSKILRFYTAKKIPFFLFAPTLTLFAGGMDCVTYIPTACGIGYENGANVNTSFITNLDECLVRTAPDLFLTVNRAVEEVRKEKRRELPRYEYPDSVVTAAMVAKYSKYGIDYKIRKADALFIRSLDAQKEQKKSVFGGGFLLSEKAAAEKAAAEKAAAEKAAAEKAAAHIWELSEREISLVRSLGGE